MIVFTLQNMMHAKGASQGCCPAPGSAPAWAAGQGAVSSWSWLGSRFLKEALGNLGVNFNHHRKFCAGLVLVSSADLAAGSISLPVAKLSVCLSVNLCVCLCLSLALGE